MIQVVEFLSGKRKSLNSNPYTAKNIKYHCWYLMATYCYCLVGCVNFVVHFDYFMCVCLSVCYGI
jgi:hypothetical protein